MKVGSLVVLVVALLGFICFLGNRGKLRSQQTEPAPAPVVPSQPSPVLPAQVAQEARAEEKTAEAVIGPAGFPYSALMPVEPIAPFKDNGFKVGVVAYLKGSDTTNHRITFTMGSEQRTAELRTSFRLFAVDQNASKELDASKLSTIPTKERCLFTLENRAGEDAVTQICILSGDFARSRDRKEIIEKVQELQHLIYQWRVVLVNYASGENNKLTPEDVKRGKETIALAERRLMMNSMDGDGDSMRFHTRGGVKSFDLEKRKVTLAQGGQERSWKVAKEAKVFVVTIHFFEDASSRIGIWEDFSRVYDYNRRSPYSVTEATEGMARLHGDSQVYLTFNSQGKVQRIDIMEQEHFVLPDMPWLPFSMSDVKE